MSPKILAEMLRSNELPVAGDDLPSGTFLLYSRYATVVNFVNDHNQVAYITSDRNLLAPHAIFLPGINCSEASGLWIGPEEIILDDTVFSRNTLGKYDSSFSFKDVEMDVFEERLLRIPDQESDLFPEKSLLFLLHKENESFFPSGFDRQFMLNTRESSRLIIQGEIIRGVETIRGTGYGLTPSGDDFIAGFLLGIHFNEHKYNKDLSALKERICTAATGTNLLTASFLRNAKSGKYFSPLKKVLLLLVGAAPHSLREALHGLISMGATSGADLLSGYIFAIKYKTGI